MAQRGCLRKASDLLADCEIDEVLIFGGGSFYGYLLTPAGILPVGEDLGIHIQLGRWEPPQSAICQ